MVQRWRWRWIRGARCGGPYPGHCFRSLPCLVLVLCVFSRFVCMYVLTVPSFSIYGTRGGDMCRYIRRWRLVEMDSGDLCMYG
jgi:hypothetical protein